MVPISTAIGASSYRWPGSSSSEYAARVQHRVAARADVAELVDEVDEEEQRQEGQRDERDRRDDVAVEQAPDRPHAACSAGGRPAARRQRAPPVAVLAPPEQTDARAGRRRRASATSAAPMPSLPPADPGLRQVDHVVVDDEGEQREQQVPVAGAPRVAKPRARCRAAAGWRAEQQPEPPGQLALVAPASGCGAARAWRAPSAAGRRRARGRARRRARGSSRSARATSRRSRGSARCAARDRARGSGRRLRPRCGRCAPRSPIPGAAASDRMKTLRPTLFVLRVAFDEEDAPAVARASGTGPARRARGRIGARSARAARRRAG